MSEPESRTPTRLTARALLVSDRIDTAGLERPDTLSQAPFAFRAGADGMVALFRFGAAVMVGLSPLEEEDLLAQLGARIAGPRAGVDDETATLVIAGDRDEPVEAGGPIHIKSLSPERFLVIADALAKSVALARDEREVNRVFDVIEPFARELAASGRPPFSRRAMLQLIGQALIAQHRKLEVIVETAHALTDIIDANRATRLEATVVILIVVEVLVSLTQIVLA